MEIVVHDNTLKTVAVINNDIPMLPSFFNDNWHRYKDQGAETFIFTVNKFINGQLQDYCRFLNEQAYISFTYDGIDHLFGVDNVQESDYQITLTCSSLNLELRNEQANALVNTSSHNIQWYFDQMELISNAQITIGTNEVSSLTRTINYDGQESKLARLISVIGNFNAEFEFITHLNDDGTLDSIILNIYRANDGVNIQGVGTNRNDVSLNFGKNISGITRTGDTTNLFNATKITGSDDLNWNSSEFSYVNSDGMEEFYKRKNDDTAFAPLSLNLFKSQIKSNNGDKWIRKDFQTEYTNVNDMWGYCVSQFKQFAYPTVTYEVLANSSLVLESVGNDRPLSIGDTINIQDDNFMDSDGNVGLLLSARVSEMEISFSNPTLNKITFSNFKKQQSEASADIQAIVNQLVDAATPYIGSIDTTNGTQFKNGTGSTTLSAHIFKGSATTETIADSYEWSKDGTVVAPTQTITVDASGVADKAVYSFKATVAGKVVASQSVTITNVNDGAKGAQGPQGPQGPQGLKGDPGATGIPGQAGADGKTSYLHIAYATNSTGTAGFDVSNATGKTYIGQYTDFTSADSTDPSKYTWSLIKGDKGDKGDQGAQGIQGLQGPTGTQGVAGPKGNDGKTQYTHIAYANSADGVTDFSTSDSNRTYIGMYVDFIINDSTTPSDYSWTLVKGADGTQGTPGKPGADGKTPYFHTAWSYSADGMDRFTTVYPNLNLLTGTSNQVVQANNWYMQVADIKYDKSLGGALCASVLFNNADHASDLLRGSATIMIETFDKSGKSLTTVYGNSVSYNANGLSQSSISIDDNTANVKAFIFTNNMNSNAFYSCLKIEQGSIATPWMRSASEVTTADYPSYIGQYTDFAQADSTNPSAYTWSLIRGNDGKDGANGKDGLAGKDGVGIKTTVITYAISISGTIAPTTGWTSSVPSLVKGQYLWTKTVWTYTDNSFETGYSVTYISKDGNNGNDGIAGKDGVGIKTTTITYAGSTSGTTAPTSGWTTTVPTVAAGSYLWTKTVWTYTDNTSETGYSVAKMGNNGATGPQGPAGSNGDPGKVVSDTEPSTRFKGLTWKYSGTTDLTASDGTVIKPNTEYYYNGTHWVINYFSVNNFAAESITSDKIDGKNLTITDGEFISKTTNGPVTTSTEIKDNHIAISKTDGTVNTRNDIALDSEQGLAQKFTNINTGFYRTAGINYQGPFTSDSDGNYAQLTPQGTKLSTDVPWTKLSLMNNFTGNIEYAIINGTVYISASGVGVPAMTAGQWKQAAQLPTGSSAIPIRANRIAAGDSGDGLSWALLSNQAGGIFIRCSANKAPTANLFNATLPYPIG
ncbi:collagen-like protein [Lactococcus lactis]|uniref:collagen-like protein n=1 Tax=Lactococcus lactis TaxID=1358 RepID=UPI0009C232AB|nr:collagen-like protein [Lactococcus lactis]ARE01423.1 prophage protein TAL [Lactococcus lactis subsp. lactis]ARE03766.1 prophage TAL protein [Lactococcus lactis subsp. lactis]QRZ27667.1 collagen-like protein [Lactococcus lactis subsp. lactis]QSD60157.2 collagen-like protein [Lactococcus lactis subsp. lactis]UOB67057.1 collagen-like protein [Lactococcus lactis]